jgi:hypothetical protein
MHRSFLRFTRTLLLPLLAVGLILTGCDSSGSNGDDPGNTPGDDPGDDPSTFAYPTTTYGEETVVNLLAFDLGVRASNASDNDEAVFTDLYNGNNLDGTTLPSALGVNSPQQNTYGDIASDIAENNFSLAGLTSDATLIRSDQLEASDTPNAGSGVNTDALLAFYFEKAGADNATRTQNGFVLNQFAEKMLLGTPIYGRGAEILARFADDDVDSGRAEEWDAAFGYFGFPRALEPFLDYANGEEGLASGKALDVDDNGSVDLTSEYVHTWASYAIERSAAAENNGQPNDFARDAFEALVEGREDIENGDDPTEHAEEALQAWEEVVAVNVIHYINSMKSNLEGVNGEISEGDVGEDAWGEAKAFAWNLQFYSDELDDDELNTLHELIGNDPPYGDLSADQYTDNLNEANQLLEDAYDFNGSNVDVW